MFSKTKPEIVYTYTFKNKDHHKPGEKLYAFWRDPEEEFVRYIDESYFTTTGYYELLDNGDDMVLERITKNQCKVHGYISGFPVIFKPETIAALKSIVDIENLTFEDGLVEI